MLSFSPTRPTVSWRVLHHHHPRPNLLQSRKGTPSILSPYCHQGQDLFFHLVYCSFEKEGRAENKEVAKIEMCSLLTQIVTNILEFLCSPERITGLLSSPCVSGKRILLVSFFLPDGRSLPPRQTLFVEVWWHSLGFPSHKWVLNIFNMQVVDGTIFNVICTEGESASCTTFYCFHIILKKHQAVLWYFKCKVKRNIQILN